MSAARAGVLPAESPFPPGQTGPSGARCSLLFPAVYRWRGTWLVHRRSSEKSGRVHRHGHPSDASVALLSDGFTQRGSSAPSWPGRHRGSGRGGRRLGSSAPDDPRHRRDVALASRMSDRCPGSMQVCRSSRRSVLVGAVALDHAGRRCGRCAHGSVRRRRLLCCYAGAVAPRCSSIGGGRLAAGSNDSGGVGRCRSLCP